MNREIKFRAWLKDEKRMLNDISSIKLDIKCIYYDNNDLFSYERKSFDEIELMQYTGLKDKNGVKIFEGDIVNICGFINREVVEYDNYYVGYVLKRYDNNGKVIYVTPLTEYSSIVAPKLEVIGNIYENPELLEEK